MALIQCKVVASCFDPDLSQSIKSRRQSLRQHLTELLQVQHPDLVILPETAILPDIESHHLCGAEPIDGPTVTMVSQLAAHFTANICIPVIEADNGVLYNTAVYLDRSGNLIGKYRKQVPTKTELDRGIHAGDAVQPPVIIDGLRVGTAICFDANFPDLIWNFIAAGVDLLVFPAYTFAGRLMESWAFNCGVPLVCAFPWESVIYDRDGCLLAKAGTQTSTVKFGFHSDWIACSLDFQSRIYHLDGNQLKLKEIHAKYGGQIDVRLMVRDARMKISAVSDEVTIEQVEQEFGLVPLQKYLRESRVASAENR